MTRRISQIAGGLTALWIAAASPLAHLDHHLLTAHMVQHLLLMLAAGPLVLVGIRPIISLNCRLHPAFCWLAGTITVICWHIPAAFELALRSRFWHEFEHASFFIAGILFWWPVIRPREENFRWTVPIYLFLATIPCDALSAFLAFYGHVVYRPYLSAGYRLAGVTPLEDQALAGAVMWVTVTFAYLVPALAVTNRLLSGARDKFKCAPEDEGAPENAVL